LEKSLQHHKIAEASPQLDTEEAEYRAKRAASAFLARLGISVPPNDSVDVANEASIPNEDVNFHQDKAERASRAAALFISRIPLDRYAVNCASTESPLPESGSRRRVHFNADVEVREITPYSCIYGIHPREFVFGRHYCMIPATGPHGFIGVGDDTDNNNAESECTDDDGDDDDDLF